MQSYSGKLWKQLNLHKRKKVFECMACDKEIAFKINSTATEYNINIRIKPNQNILQKCRINKIKNYILASRNSKNLQERIPSEKIT